MEKSDATKTSKALKMSGLATNSTKPPPVVVPKTPEQLQQQREKNEKNRIYYAKKKKDALDAKEAPKKGAEELGLDEVNLPSHHAHQELEDQLNLLNHTKR